MITGETIVEKFRVYGLDLEETIAYEQSDDLSTAVRMITGGTVSPNPMEAQVLVRHNVDDEGISIVYVDGAVGGILADVTTMTAAIRILTEARDRLATLTEPGR